MFVQDNSKAPNRGAEGEPQPGLFLAVHGLDVDDILGFIVLWMIWWMYFLLFCVILQQMLQLQQLLQIFFKTVADCVEYTHIRRNYKPKIASKFNVDAK